MRRIPVALADDHQIVRDGIRALLNDSPDCRVVGEEADGVKVADLVADARPDVLLVDLMMPGLPGLDIVREVARRAPDTRILVFSMYAEETQVKAALRNGAVGYVLKDAPSVEVLRAIRHVTGGPGRYYFSPPLAGVVFEEYAKSARAGGSEAGEALSPRERQVMQLVLEGFSSTETAKRLDISPRTVESHRARLMRKLGLRNRSELFRYASRHGLLPQG